MTVFIALDATQAEKLRGITTPGHALSPQALADGVTFILPLEVLDDPAHAEVLSNFALGKIGSVESKESVGSFEPVDVYDAKLQREVQDNELKTFGA